MLRVSPYLAVSELTSVEVVRTWQGSYYTYQVVVNDIHNLGRPFEDEKKAIALLQTTLDNLEESL